MRKNENLWGETETEQNPSLFRLIFKESFQKGDW